MTTRTFTIPLPTIRIIWTIPTPQKQFPNPLTLRLISTPTSQQKLILPHPVPLQ